MSEQIVQPNKKLHIYRGIYFDSQEEIEFHMWLEEASTAGFVRFFNYKPEPFLLTDAQTVMIGDKKKHLIRKLIYTPDYYVVFSEQFSTTFEHGLFLAEHGQGTYIDVKGVPNVRQGANTSMVTFPIKQAWVYQKYGVYVNKVIARDMKLKGKVTKQGFFSKTFVPEQCAWMKARKTPTRMAAFANCRLLREIV